LTGILFFTYLCGVALQKAAAANTGARHSVFFLRNAGVSGTL
jgi:hypothetical protein